MHLSSKLKTWSSVFVQKEFKFFWIHFSLNDEKELNLTICEIVKILVNNP